MANLLVEMKELDGVSITIYQSGFDLNEGDPYSNLELDHLNKKEEVKYLTYMRGRKTPILISPSFPSDQQIKAAILNPASSFDNLSKDDAVDYLKIALIGIGLLLLIVLFK